MNLLMGKFHFNISLTYIKSMDILQNYNDVSDNDRQYT